MQSLRQTSTQKLFVVGLKFKFNYTSSFLFAAPGILTLVRRLDPGISLESLWCSPFLQLPSSTSFSLALQRSLPQTCLWSKAVFSSVQLLCRVQLFETPWTAARQVSLSITNSQSLLKLIWIESEMPSNHLILCCPPLLLPSIFPSIRVCSKESVLRIRWPKYWNLSFSFRPSNEYSGLISFRLTGLISLQSKGFSRVFSNTTVQKHQLFCIQPSL